MYGEIIKILEKIEKENDINILYACESGSRAWGFDNQESDWDVRFIFKRNDIRDYLKLEDKNDVIEHMDGELDIVGWDIKKALLLHHNNNPNLREWIISPIKYIEFKQDIFRGLPDFDMAVLKYHYTSIAVNNWKKLGQDDLELTKRAVKMFLYNIRCILIWLIIDDGGNPPINIFELLDEVNLDENIKGDINGLIDYYKNNCQNTLDLEVIDNVRKWMGFNLKIMRSTLPQKEGMREFDGYNDRFFDIILPNFDEHYMK